MGYRLSRLAERDIDEILDYGVREFGIGPARKYRDDLIEKLHLLARMPRIARLRSGAKRSARVHVHGTHVILFQEIASGEILIIRVKNQRENWVSYFS